MRVNPREALLRRLTRLARRALFGALSETYRTRGQPSCRCHRGDKHGPHLYISFRGAEGKTTGYYVPEALGPVTRQGVEAWRELQDVLRALAELNRQRQWARRKASQGGKKRHGSSSTRAAQRL
jgi:hypothetical protein